MKILVWEFPDYYIGRKYLIGVVLSRYIISMLPNAFYFNLVMFYIVAVLRKWNHAIGGIGRPRAQLLIIFYSLLSNSSKIVLFFFSFS